MREGGYFVAWDPDGAIEECSTFTCAHCNKVVFVKPKADPDRLGGLCYLCMKPICPACVGQACIPFEKRLEAVEAKDRFRRSL